jgi:glycosyltransferase involved in cell wall biosynthesis
LAIKATLLVPALNEIEGMKVIMPRIKKEWFHQILVIDGQSTDGTAEYARECGYDVHVQKERGIRTGYVEALPYVTGDVIITFSPDGNSIPEVIPDLLAKMEEGYDMVIASRYLDDAKSEDDDMVTGFGNWLFTKTINVLYGAKYTDALVMYRAFRTSLIEELEITRKKRYRYAERLFLLPDGDIGWEPIFSISAAVKKLKVTEIPCDEPARIGGNRKLKVVRWGGAIYVQILKEWIF